LLAIAQQRGRTLYLGDRTNRNDCSPGIAARPQESGGHGKAKAQQESQEMLSGKAR
jgi:hypothetical protein